jgi:hypothetical protein
VAHACNPSYSRGRDQKDGSLKPAQANSSQEHSLKKNHHKKGQVEWLMWFQCLSSKCEALSSNPSAAKKQQKKWTYDNIWIIKTKSERTERFKQKQNHTGHIYICKGLISLTLKKTKLLTLHLRNYRAQDGARWNACLLCVSPGLPHIHTTSIINHLSKPH